MDNDKDYTPTAEEIRDMKGQILRQRSTLEGVAFVSRKTAKISLKNDSSEPAQHNTLPTTTKACATRLVQLERRLKAQSYDQHLSLRSVQRQRKYIKKPKRRTKATKKQATTTNTATLKMTKILPLPSQN